MYRWSEEDGVSVFLDPSGYEGPEPSGFREPGSNGLIRGAGDSILMADHGNRAIARLDLVTRQKTFLATHFKGKRFNSPNDLVLASSGGLYFTDPPYGLEGLNQSPLKELAHNGVYRVDPGGAVTLIDDGISFPNGILLSPDERTLYVANSDPRLPVWYALELDASGTVTEKRIFANCAAEADAGRPGLPDGMAIDTNGNLFATGAGGVHIFTAQGERLGLIETGTAIANCAFGEDGATLFLASHHMLARLSTRTRGLERLSG
jgi:gluconolactonase